MLQDMNLASELRDLIAELRKHRASHDSILLHCLMHSRKSEEPWHDDDVRRFVRNYDAAEVVVQKDRQPMTPYNIVVRSETVGGVELKDFDAEVRQRSAEAADRQAVFRSATESQRMVQMPRKRGRPPKIRNEEETL